MNKTRVLCLAGVLVVIAAVLVALHVCDLIGLIRYLHGLD